MMRYLMAFLFGFLLAAGVTGQKVHLLKVNISKLEVQVEFQKMQAQVLGTTIQYMNSGKERG